ncbi:MAG: hypothetical protein KJO35_09395, partial [Gammaproteobacteria bacterium]|nr:hypothetical protein [Gammaproteobacteria bacterium]
LTKVPYSFKTEDAVTLQGLGPTTFDQSAHVSATNNPHNVSAGQIGAASSADLTTLISQVNDLVAQVNTLQSALDTANTTIGTLQTDIGNLQTGLSDETSARLAADNALSVSLATISNNSVLALDTILTLDGTTARFSDVNVQIGNGSGFTDKSNGTGNLIIGYDAPGGFCSNIGFNGNEAGCTGAGETWTPSAKSGSHNLVIGDGHDYSGYGGLVAGLNNRVSGPWSSVSGGFGNTASGPRASILGGFLNSAAGIATTIAGGRNNVASGEQATVSGGSFSTADGTNATVSGGDQNTASGIGATVGGGANNVADAFAATIGGGSNITLLTPGQFEAGPSAAVLALQTDSVPGLGSVLSVSGNTATFSGVNVQIVNGTGATDDPPNGTGNLIVGYDAPGGFCSVAGITSQSDCTNNVGGIWQPSLKSGSHNVVVGDGHHYSQYGGLVSGSNNRISGPWGNVIGGHFNTASGSESSVAGGFYNIASGEYSSVAGGFNNAASGGASSVAGGRLNTASGPTTSVVGGDSNEAAGFSSSVAAGHQNAASGDFSSIAGGEGNTAQADFSTAVGGDGVICSGDVCGEGSLGPSDP